MSRNLSPFMNPPDVTSYVRDTPGKVPGLADLHRMVTLLLSERAGQAAHILVVGAGGGMELNAMAQARPDWQFTGVDPSPAMLDVARKTVAPHADRIALLEGTVDQAPSGPFDGATCLLTLHFLGKDERLHLLTGIRQRLRPGSAVVIAHHSAPESDPVPWLARSVRFGQGAEADASSARYSAAMMAGRLSLLSSGEEEALLKDAGFTGPTLFYAALSFRGWVAVST